MWMRVPATLDAHVEHDIVGFPTGPTHGREAARGFYDALFNDLSDSAVRNDPPLLTASDFLVDESQRSGKATGQAVWA